jgi:starch-binding outer membrane protein, SusD/RagB family
MTYIQTKRRPSRARSVVSIIAIGALAGCANSLVPDLNNAAITDFQSAPTGAAAGAIAVGLVRGSRDNLALFLENIGILGREGFEMGVAQGDLPLYTNGPLTPQTFFVAQMWSGEYADLRAANTVLDALAKVPDLTTAQKAALTGFVQTMEAFDLEMLVASRDTFGIPIAVDISPVGDPAPIAPKAAVYQHIISLLDSAKTNLQAGGSAFSFALPAGFSGFDTPATFLTVNRGLRARADILTNDYTTALTDLQASFLSESAPLSEGPQFNFSNNSGDEANPNFAPFLYADTVLVSAAQRQNGDTDRDARVLQKLVHVQTFTLDGITSNVQFTLYNSTTSPEPMLRNEELILLRAEAELETGDVASATADINFIRVNSGNLAPIANPYVPTANQPTLLDELLYEKRYSLLWESGNNWISMRHYNKLNLIPKELSSERIFPIVPYPLAECQARTPQPAGCTTVSGS